MPKLAATAGSLCGAAKCDAQGLTMIARPGRIERIVDHRMWLCMFAIFRQSNATLAFESFDFPLA